MKKIIILGSVIGATISLNAHAWSISIGGVEAKGDDPQIVKNATEGTKHALTQVSNGTRDAIAAVGNATGITDVIESNKKTFADYGGYRACLATLCLSEIVKKREIERAEKEAKAQCNREIAETKRYYNRMSKENRINELRSIWQKSSERWQILNRHAQLLKKKQDAVRAMYRVSITELNYRKSLSKAGVKNLPPVAYTEMQQPTLDFQNNMDKDYQGALVKINTEIERLENITGRSRNDLMSEFIRLIHWEKLSVLKDKARVESDANVLEYARVKEELAQANADMEWAKLALEKEQK